MVFTFGIRTDLEYVVMSLHGDKVMLEQITGRSQASNRYVRLDHFEHSLTKLLRTMDEKVSAYQTNDPVCNLKRYLPRLKKTSIHFWINRPSRKEKSFAYLPQLGRL